MVGALSAMFKWSDHLRVIVRIPLWSTCSDLGLAALMKTRKKDLPCNINKVHQYPS